MIKKLKINCISNETPSIFERREHVLLGISPFNGYFTEDNITTLIEWGLKEFSEINVFIPDTLPLYNFLALGYSKEKAIYKVKRQANYLRNKVLRSFLNLGYDKKKSENLIINMEFLENNPNYIKIRDYCYTLYDNNVIFRNKCLQCTEWILQGYSQQLNHNNTSDSKLAVNYLLKEMPLFLNTPIILDVPSSIFVYHQTPNLLLDLFSNKLELGSDLNQGFMQLNF